MPKKCSTEALLSHTKELNVLKSTRTKLVSGSTFYNTLNREINKKEKENDAIRVCLGQKTIFKKVKKS
jgi:hypothetical protein